MDPPLRDAFLIGISDPAGVRLLAVDATTAAEEVRVRHGLWKEAAQVAAEGLVAALLMSAYTKGEERITFQVQGERPRFSFAADVDADGRVRARFSPATLPAARPLSGLVLVIKHLPGRELYRGTAPLEHGDFQGALQAYLVRSQQTVGGVRIASRLGSDGEVALAAGLLVEKLPDASTEVFADLFGDLAACDLRSVQQDLAAKTLRGFPVEVLERRGVRFACPCSQARCEAILLGLGAGEIRSLLEAYGQAEMTCQWCGRRYVVPAEQLERLEAEALRRPRA
ncbi:MAG: Hsp33 family molecular chaperone HslO [Deltaproteobacteria bacterium]|nr:Hsp33 family molecular chaperone HslO [Deltaproteobacteria bacterium]